MVTIAALLEYKRARGDDFPKGRVPSVFDSGGYTQLSLHGEWTISPDDFGGAVYRFMDDGVMPTWCAPQDWMFTHPSDTCRSSWSTMSILITSWMGELWLLSCHCQAGGPWGSTTSGGRGLRSRTSFRGWVTC